MKPYCVVLDRLEMNVVCWRSYEGHREIQEVKEIFWYSGWIMCGVENVYYHLPDRVKEQCRYVQDIPRPPTSILAMRDNQIVQAFLDIRVHTIHEDHWGQPTRDMPWRYEDEYMLWYGWVSHPQIFHLFRDLLRDQQMRSI